MLNKLLVEFLGTFGMTISIICSSISGAGAIVPGAFYACWSFCFAHISGAHLNPAISFSVYFWRHLNNDANRSSRYGLGLYVVTQFAGALFAAVLGGYILLQREHGYRTFSVFPYSPPHHGLASAVIAEIIAMFFFTGIYMNTMCSTTNPRNPLSGLMLGFALTSCIWACAYFSGGGLNPAIVSAIWVANEILSAPKFHYVLSGFACYWWAPLLGASFASMVHFVNENKPEDGVFDEVLPESIASEVFESEKLDENSIYSNAPVF